MTFLKRLQKFRTDDVHYPDLCSASDWLKEISSAARPIRSTDKIWKVKRHQYGIFVLVPQTSFRGEIIGGVGKFRLFPQAVERACCSFLCICGTLSSNSTEQFSYLTLVRKNTFPTGIAGFPKNFVSMLNLSKKLHVI